MNSSITIKNGSLTMCDIWDFRDTLQREHTVFTLCKYPPNFIYSDKQERYHFYFRAHDEGTKAWVIAVRVIEDLLNEGKDVLLHCVHGRDRTGGVAYVIFRRTGLSHDETTELMKEIRPLMTEAWDDKLEKRKPFYEEILKDAQVYTTHTQDYFEHKTKSKRGLPYRKV